MEFDSIVEMLQARLATEGDTVSFTKAELVQLIADIKEAHQQTCWNLQD